MFASCCTLVSREVFGFGDGEGVGAGGVDGWVTKVIVVGAASDCWVLVRAPGPIVTWYWVFGARSPLTGWMNILASPFQAKVTLVAGVICTAFSVDGWSIGWLKDTRIGCRSATADWSARGLWTMISLHPPGRCAAVSLPTDPRITTTAAAPPHPSRG